MTEYIKLGKSVYCKNFVSILMKYLIGGAVENRTPVRKQVTDGVYMLRKVVSFNLDFTQLAKLDQTSLKGSFYAETDAKHI